MSSSTYFSIDYRSPPSGMGQIINPSEPEMVDGKHNMILVNTITVEDIRWAKPHPSYVDTRTFLLQDDWFNLDEFSQLYDYLLSQGVEYVHDSEMSYEYPEHFDENQNIPLVDWIMIIKQTAC